MDVMDLFDLSKKFDRVIIPGGSSQGYVRSNGLALEEDVPVRAPSETGTEYVAEYVEREQKHLLEAVKFGSGNTDNIGDLMSVGTCVPNIEEINAEELTKIYKTYNFAYRPKFNLPITSVKDEIMSKIESHRVTVIEGPTGCGKTTQVPQFILDSCFRKKVHCNIIVTQPRRIAAISIAKRVGEERQWPVGTLVGYQVGMVNNTSTDTRLTYCTTGVLLQKLINTKHMLDFTHVILDEVHERDQEMDFLLLVVRKLLYTNSSAVKVILMSATFNVEKFSQYFSMPVRNELIPAPIVDVAKKNFFTVNTYYLCQMAQLGPLPEVFADEPAVSHKMMRFCLNMIQVLDVIDKKPTGGESEDFEDSNRSVILIFLPGIYEIEEMYEILNDTKNDDSKWDVVVLHSSITNEEQQRIFEKPPSDYRRIILSTNIAESSITVPDVKYVIDFCLTKQLVTDPSTNFQCLELTWASKVNCEQRKGRTGRVMDGRVYRLVPQTFYENVLPSEGAPEILRAPLERVVLQAKLLDMGEPKAILALSLDPPDLSNLERTVLLLKESGALLDFPDNPVRYDGKLTDLGRVMAHLPVDIHVSKLIVLGHVFSVLGDAIIIGSGLSVKSMFNTPFKERLKAYNAKLTWADSSCSDCISFLNVYRVWTNERAIGRLKTKSLEQSWAKRHFVQIKVLREIEALIQDITKRLERMGIRETVGANRVVWGERERFERPFVMKIVIAGAFYPNYFVRQVQGGQIDERAGVKLLGGLDPSNTVYLQGWQIRQPGLLYARRFQDLFKQCLSSAAGGIKVSFDGSSRVYIQFSKNQVARKALRVPEVAEVPGKVSLSVYKAVKMRQNNVPIEIPLLDQESANRRAKELNLEQNTVGALLRKAQPPEVGPQLPNVRPVLPSIDVSHIPLLITNIEDPGHFWAQMKDEETLTNLLKINAILNAPNGKLNELSSKPPIGSLVVAPFEEFNTVKYYRAVVQSYIGESKDMLAQVFFVDYGNIENVKLRELRMITDHEEICEIPGLAFECVLCNVQPSILRNLKGHWNDDARQTFHQLLSRDIQLYGKIYSVVSSVVSLELIRVDANNEMISVNEILRKKGFADYKDEDYLSRYNQELREHHAEMTAEQRKHCEQQQYGCDSLCDDYPEAPLERDCRSKVRLKGPFSPLEMELVHLASAGRSKKVHVEWNSVNSVLLDTDSQDSHERLLVAASVGQNVSGTSLTLRNTTLMPNIHGLPALICLIFSPCMELRRNHRGNRYTGALCGLGFDPSTNASLFPEHDIFVPFDVEITIDDLQEINKLRHWINMAIHLENSTSCDNMAEVALCQNKVKECLFKLIRKKRESQEPQIDANSRKWNIYDPSLYLEPGSGRMAGIADNAIYKLHNALELEEENAEQEALYAHVEELRNLANMDVRTNLTIEECQLCKKKIFDVQNLRIHLNSLEHRRREEDEGIEPF